MNTEADHDPIREQASRLPRGERTRLEGVALDQMDAASVGHAARILPFPPVGMAHPPPDRRLTSQEIRADRNARRIILVGTAISYLALAVFAAYVFWLFLHQTVIPTAQAPAR